MNFLIRLKGNKQKKEGRKGTFTPWEGLVQAVPKLRGQQTTTATKNNSIQ